MLITEKKIIWMWENGNAKKKKKERGVSSHVLVNLSA